MRREHGFTLLETLLALACTGLVLAAAGRAVMRAADVRAGASERASGIDAARVTLTTIMDELPAALPGSLRLERIGNGPPHLRFTVADPTPTAISYELDGDRLMRRAPSAFAAPNAPLPQGTAQLTQVAQFDVRVLARDGWTSTWSDDRLPRAVEIVLQPAGDLPLTVRVALPMRGS
ncbi:MAG TPA: type II secretion system protein GspJ [Candidatus Binatia bacterium]|jgi:type II secretory pathway pseudopilin PulG|nr:type II secretion system protein GspJ [Candidatus Binatia bacterium]